MQNCNQQSINQTAGNDQQSRAADMEQQRRPSIAEVARPGVDISRETPEKSASLLLESGQYRVKFRTSIDNPRDEKPFTLKNFDIDIPIENEFKRVEVFKLDSVPIDNETREITVKFAVIDNPVWLAPILWTLPAVGGWFVVDKVESFAEQNPISLGLVMLTALGAFATIILK